MAKFCDYCGCTTKTKVIIKKETYKVKDEYITIDANVLICSECGNELPCEELDNATLIKTYNKYREKHNLLFPEEIKSIREQYGLSPRSFAKLLNWGDKTIYRYENGAIQDAAHNSILLFLRDPENMKTYLTNNDIPLSPKQKQKLLQTVNNMAQNKILANNVIKCYFDLSPNETNGFRAFDFEKFCSMVLFFISKNKDLSITKLMTLLYYSDKTFFRENTLSISGTKYIHMPYGPMPENFDLLIGLMSSNHIIRVDISIENGTEKNWFVPQERISQNDFSKLEYNTMEKIDQKFTDYNSAELFNYVRRDEGYKSTNTEDIIPYVLPFP